MSSDICTHITAALFIIATTWKKVFTDRWMDEEAGIHIHTMDYYLAIQKEGNPAICSNMDGPWGHYAKWNWSKSDWERQISIWHHLYGEWKNWKRTMLTTTTTTKTKTKLTEKEIRFVGLPEASNGEGGWGWSWFSGLNPTNPRAGMYLDPRPSWHSEIPLCS